MWAGRSGLDQRTGGPGLALESSACPGAEGQPDCEVPRASRARRESEGIVKVEEE